MTAYGGSVTDVASDNGTWRELFGNYLGPSAVLAGGVDWLKTHGTK